MMHHAQIAQRVFNTALMVDPAKALAFVTGLGPRLTGAAIHITGSEVTPEDQAAAAAPARASLFGDALAPRSSRGGAAPYPVVDGIAVIEIAGTLVHRGAWIGQSSGVTSYEGIAAQLQAALGDPAVRGIALDIDSFGGEVAGAFDLADRLRAARAVKPVQAFVADHALSAGYALAAQADRIVLSRTGAVGSIGVVAIHRDLSGALDTAGIAVTLIHAGARKVDANPYQPLPDPVRARMAEELEDLRQLFAATVAAGRGSRLGALAALGTEAAVFRGEAAVRAGLADAVVDPVTAFRAFTSDPRAAVDSSMGARTRTGTSAASTSLTLTSRKAPMMTTTTVAEDPPAPVGAPPAAAETAPTAPTAAAAEPVAETVPVAPATEAIRAEAAEVARVCAQAARLGVPIDASDAVARGLKPEALRARVLSELAARSDAAGILATTPPARAAESPIVAAARKTAAAAVR